MRAPWGPHSPGGRGFLLPRTRARACCWVRVSVSGTNPWLKHGSTDACEDRPGGKPRVLPSAPTKEGLHPR